MRHVYIGIGHDRGGAVIAAIALAERCRAKAGVTADEVSAVVSIAARKDDGVVAAVARHFGCDARYFSASELEAETPRLANPSESVFRAVGCHGVAESAALAAAGPNGRLLLPKTTLQGTTCAIAEVLAIVDKGA